MNCPGCGGELAAPADALVFLCPNCDTEVLLADRSVQVVKDHRLAPVEVELSDLMAEYSQAQDWKLAILPFWVIDGVFTTHFLSHEFHETLLRARMDRNQGQVEASTAIIVPAGSFSQFGISWEAATALSETDFPEMQVGENLVPFQRGLLPQEARFEHGTRTMEEARETAIEVIGWVQKELLHKRYENLEIRDSEVKIHQQFLLHVPVYLARERGSGRLLAFDAHTGRSLTREPEVIDSVTIKPRPRFFYSRLGTALCLSVAGHAASATLWRPGGLWDPPKIWILALLTVLPQLLAFQVLLFVAKEPRGILEAERGGSVWAFNPLLVFRESRIGERGLASLLFLYIAITSAPIWLLATPLLVVAFPLWKAVDSLLSGTGFWRVLFRESYKTMIFCIRTGAVVLTGGAILWSTLYDLYHIF